MTDSVDSHMKRVSDQRITLFKAYFWLIGGLVWFILAISSPVIPDGLAFFGVIAVFFSLVWIIIVEFLWKQYRRRYKYR